MTLDLSGKVAAITGGASGIGLACAKAMIAAGCRVFIVDRSEERLREACTELGASATPLAIDLLDPKSVAGMLPNILSEAGQLDIFHANAGSYVGGEVIDGDPDAWDRMLNLNINAVFRSIHAVLPHMAERGIGDIIVTSSVSGYAPLVWEPIYTASKHAVQAFVHTLRRQVMKNGIRVGAVAPGPVITALLSDWPPERLEAAKANGTLMDAEEVAAAVIFMLTRPRGIMVRDLVIMPSMLDL